MNSAICAQAGDTAWEVERKWLIDFTRRGAPITTEVERARVMAALDRWEIEVGEGRDRFAVHEAGHAVVAHALGWYVEYVEPQKRDGGACMLAHQYANRGNAWKRFLEQATVSVAGYVAEELAFGFALPFEVMELRIRAWREHCVDDDQFGALIEYAETQARRLVAEGWASMTLLAEAQLACGRMEGDALAEILAAPN